MEDDMLIAAVPYKAGPVLVPAASLAQAFEEVAALQRALMDIIALAQTALQAKVPDTAPEPAPAPA